MTTRAIALASALLLALAGAAQSAFAMGSDDTPAATTNDDYAKDRAAIDHQDWAGAIAAFQKVVAHDGRNADAYNWLGYANRKSGKLDAAFRNYDKALALDPGHKGAYEYQGEAYLMAKNLPKAEANLAALAKLCNASCEEYKDLKEAIDDYKTGKTH